MEMGVPKEIKDNEYRVAATPEFASQLAGHLYMEKSAGEGSGFSDEDYKKNRAFICSAEEAWSKDLILKVKEPQEKEYAFFSPGKTLFTYLHLAGSPEKLTLALLKNKVTAIALETVESNKRRILLDPMSAVAGTMAIHIGTNLLAKNHGGRGVLLNDIPGVEHAKVLVLGAGNVGFHAIKTAHEIGADVSAIDINEQRLEELRRQFPRLKTAQSTPGQIEKEVATADLVVGAAVLPGSRAPHIVTESMVKRMKNGAAVVDVAIDQGGCFETSRPTSHSSPTFVKHGVVHYCVPNMPGVYPRTSTEALTSATLPFVKQLEKGIVQALKQSPSLAAGVNTFDGFITHRGVAEALQLTDKYSPLKDLI
ncbi:alanine dehydrogenase [Candidatus Micrarchaeota archaeon]|nr:alanine dehydrogenase [Candidatus Micrarchaeota archaeon]